MQVIWPQILVVHAFLEKKKNASNPRGIRTGSLNSVPLYETYHELLVYVHTPAEGVALVSYAIMPDYSVVY